MNSDEYPVMDNKNLEAEIHPLKNEDGKAPDNHENCAEKEALCRKPTRLSQLSRWRTAAFFLSLFLCLIVVFAFSFIIPCPVRPVSQRTWNRKYDRVGESDVLNSISKHSFPCAHHSQDYRTLAKVWPQSRSCRNVAHESVSCRYPRS